MSEEKTLSQKKLKRVVIFDKTVNFADLEEWTDPEKDDLPILSYVGFYRAIGLIDAAKEYVKTHPDYYLYHLDSIYCNFFTHKAIKKLIKDNWCYYDVDIDANNHTFWNTKKFPKGMKHYKKSLRKKIAKCVNQDFNEYCPGIDENIETVGRIILVDYVPVDEENEA